MPLAASARATRRRPALLGAIHPDDEREGVAGKTRAQRLEVAWYSLEG
jgi:hypothetical protein